MLRTAATVAALLCLSAPALADPAAPGPKMKKICHAVNNGNPLFPTYKCTSVPVETAAAPAPAATPVATAEAAPAPTQVAQNGATPH